MTTMTRVTIVDHNFVPQDDYYVNLCGICGYARRNHQTSTSKLQPEQAESEHTPLPWHFDSLPADLQVIRSVDGKLVACMNAANGQFDAPLILRAVNNYTRLVAALEQFISIYPPNARRHPDVAIAIQNAETVLSRVRE